MHEGAEAKDEEPGFAIATIEIRPGKSNKDEKEEGMAKYPAITHVSLKNNCLWAYQ